MRFRQLISPTNKNLYDLCLNQAPFYQKEVIEETRPDHNYARPWIDDPTISTALPHVELFSTSHSSNDSHIEIDDNPNADHSNMEKINWAPTINTLIPDTFECPQELNNNLTSKQETFVREIRELIDETRLAALCCELNSCDVVYWRLSIHRIVSKLSSLLTRDPNYEHLLDWLHEYICQTFDRSSIGHYVDLFQILYHEYPNISSSFVQKNKPWPTTSLCSYVYNKVIQKPNDLTEEVIYSLTLSPLSMPIVCLLIPGIAYGNHMERIQFWQKNLSQVATVMLSTAIENDNKTEQSQIQSAYEDIIKKFNEIRQLYPNHNMMFLGWNVGCILALKAALVCPVSSIICMSPPFLALSEESKNDFTQINASILFIIGENQSRNQLNHYRERLKSRNGLIELGQCDDKLVMSEDGKYRFRLTQQMIDKLIMEEILDFITILSPKSNQNDREELEAESRKKKFDRINSTPSLIEDSDDPFLYMGDHAFNSYNNNNTSTTLTIAPEQDPNTIFLNTFIPPTTTARKRKGSNINDHLSLTDKPAPKRGRHKTETLPPTDDLEWAPDNEKRPIKAPNKKVKQSMPPTATTSILNTLLQLPSNQPKQRTNESNLIKAIHQPPSFVNTVLSSNSFL